MIRRAASRPSGVGSFLLVLGFVTILAVSFGAGVGAGRRWPHLLPSLGGVPAAKAERQDAERGSSGRMGATRGASTVAASRERSTPELTFYHELTAPLAAPPPAVKPRPERPDRPYGPERVERVERSRPEAAKPEPAKPDAARAELRKSEVTLPERTTERRFTIQVGAYKTREQAEAMRARLAAVGHDAYVASAADGSPGARFRVRVGAFATREEARQVADRIATDRNAAAFVTTR